VEDQGWLAWFSIRAVQGLPVTIYGDGKQVRDVLYIDDLIRAYECAIEHIDRAAGQAYNIGGGAHNTLSLLELLDLLESHFGVAPSHSIEDWRPGDQRVFISDIRKAKADLGWEPRVSAPDGVRRLLQWIEQNRTLFDCDMAMAHSSVS
jgi:CDP-paratose 2-epimerase